MRRKHLFKFGGIVFLFLSFSPSLFGQNAELDGAVKDRSGAVVPGVEVTLINNATNLSLSVVSSDTGRYLFVNVPPGRYTLAAEIPGFKRWANPDLILQVGDTRTLDIPLEIGEINEEVIVNGETPPVDRR